MTTSLRSCNHSNPTPARLFCRGRGLATVACVIPPSSRRPRPPSMSPNYTSESMCEAKMDPESPESDESRPLLGTTNGKADQLANHRHLPPTTPLLRPKADPDEDELEEEDLEEDDLSSDDMISVGGSPSPSPSFNSSEGNLRVRALRDHQGDEYFSPLKKLRMLQVESSSSQNAAGLKSFSISDILSHKPTVKSSSSSNHSNRAGDGGTGPTGQRIVRPWDAQQQQQHQQHHHHHGQPKTNGRRNSSDSSPLDALFQMTSKTFEGLNGHHPESEMGGQGNAHQMFNSRQPPKKKRKSRTAFTNHQIFELEKRFLYQKYLSPADRDDIAQQLGLTNAQVITWFQNRRAKLKRDMEELKKDMESAKILSAHKSFLESAHDLGLLKKRAQSQMDMSSAAAAASFHISSPTSSSQSSHSPINLTSESPPSNH